MTDLGTQLRRRAGLGGTAVVCGDQVVGYRELDARADAWAAVLGERLRPGQGVATLSRAGIEQIALLYGCARAGLLLTPLPYRLRPGELAVLLDDAAPALLLTDPAHRKAAADAVARATHRVPVAPLATPAAAGRLDAAPDPEAAVLLCYTSGSSGRPRGVPLSSRMCLATDDALDGVAQLTSDDVVLQLLPQYHVGGWTVLPLLALARGATLVLEPDFDPARAVRLIGARRVTVTMAVPAMYRAMLAAADAAQLSSLRLAICGVERALLNHPAVTDAAVVGVPDERWGTVGIAFVVAATALEPESVRDWCRHRVAGFKVPARVLVVPGLPRTGIGKVCRDLLREQARGDRR